MSTFNRPEFLQRLDVDPESAKREFCDFVENFISSFHPRFLTYFEPEDRNDVRQEILLHCLASDCRVLRQYCKMECTFEAWFYVTAHNKAMDVLKAKKRRPTTVTIDDPTNNSTVNKLQSNTSLPVDQLEHKQLLSSINQLILQMDRYCQILLRLGGDELTPIEITRVLRWPVQKSKKVSDDLRYCRDKLRKRMRERGLSTL